jgi:hypothetical protein
VLAHYETENVHTLSDPDGSTPSSEAVSIAVILFSNSVHHGMNREGKSHVVSVLRQK